MRRCKRCVIPDTRPGIEFDENGVCRPCLNAEKKKATDWDSRWGELEEMCNRFRRDDDYYDCIITASGGKDSYFQVHVFKNLLGMNPLIVNVANISWTNTGRANFDNISDAFGCDILSLNLNRSVARKMLRKGLEKMGAPTWYWDRAVYCWPLQMGIKLGIPFIIYGENISYEYGGPCAKETYSARDQIRNNAVVDVPWEFWLGDGITMKDLNPCMMPSVEEMECLEPIYLSYFVPWDGRKNLEVAKKYGFKDLDDTGEWKREGYIEQYDQIDSAGYLVHPWFKWPKFGHCRATDVACYWIRNGHITREEAMELVREHDHKLDPYALRDFCAFCGYTEDEFWDIVDGYWNPKIFKKVNGEWKLRPEIDWYEMV